MKYREMRFGCHFPIVMALNGERMLATIINVSPAGARLQMPIPPEPGEVVTLEMGKRRLAGTVRWARAEMFGLRLLTPFDKRELALIRRERAHVAAQPVGRWNRHLHELR